MSATNELWNSTKEEDWRIALEKYWIFVKPTHLEIEKEFDSINIKEIERMNADQWYEFLRTKYFFWKFTARNRYVSTTNQLKKYLGPDDTVENLLLIKERIFSFDKEDVAAGLETACKIRGLGRAGASGLLSLLFPLHFATVDQFAVKALSEVHGLPEESTTSKMNPSKVLLSIFFNASTYCSGVTTGLIRNSSRISFIL